MRTRVGTVVLTIGLLAYVGGCAASFPAATHSLLPRQVWTLDGNPLTRDALMLWASGALGYLVGVLLLGRALRWRVVLGLCLALAVSSVFVGWPMLTADPREYILLAHAETLGLDPLRAPYGSIKAMAAFAPMRLAAYRHFMNPYGPAFWGLMRVLGVLPWQLGLWAWHVFCAVAYVASAYVLLRLHGRGRAGLVALAWVNPVVAVLMVGAAHNTVVVVLPLAVSALLTLYGRTEWRTVAAAALAALAVGVSLVGLGVAVGLVATAFRSGWRRGVGAALVFGAVLTALYAPYGPVWKGILNDFGPSGQVDQSFISLAAALHLGLSWYWVAVVWLIVVVGAAWFGLKIVVLDVQRGRGAGVLTSLAVLGLLPLLPVTSVMGWYVIPSMAFGVRRPVWVTAGDLFAWLAAVGGFQLVGVWRADTAGALEWMSALSVLLGIGTSLVSRVLGRRAPA